MVFVMDKSGKALMPCTEKRARLLLERGRARVHRLIPFTIRIVDRKQEDSIMQPVRLKIDPGSKHTGIAVVLEKSASIKVLNLIELTHRGKQISESLTSRAALRRGRRSRNLRYRQPRFDNRGNQKAGWLPPSLMHRVNTTMSWVKKIMRYVPVSSISMELVKFDMQAMQGQTYAQGTLVGYEVKEYLLEKWGRACAYCDKDKVPLQVEHIKPKSKSGSDRVSNLTLACGPCNQKK